MPDFVEYKLENPKTSYERSDWRPGVIGLTFGGVLVLLIVSAVVMMAAFPQSLRDVDRRLTISPPGPRLQTDPRADLVRFDARESRRLNSYYWIDKQKGIVHVPIDQAMRKLAQTGIPGFPRAQP